MILYCVRILDMDTMDGLCLIINEHEINESLIYSLVKIT